MISGSPGHGFGVKNDFPLSGFPRTMGPVYILQENIWSLGWSASQVRISFWIWDSFIADKTDKVVEEYLPNHVPFFGSSPLIRHGS